MSETPYRAIILEHSRHPRHAGRLEPCSHRGRASNPLCGDELEVTLREAAGQVAEIRAAVRGCVIAQAGASLMATAVLHRPTAQALDWGALFRGALEGADGDLPEELHLLRPLLELRRHRSRIGCALLAWTALERALSAATPAGTGSSSARGAPPR
jgi:nitrogen fixation NifU-like protein